MKVVYLMLKCWIELNELDKAIGMIQKVLVDNKEDLQIKMAYIKVLKLKGDDFEALFDL